MLIFAFGCGPDGLGSVSFFLEVFSRTICEFLVIMR